MLFHANIGAELSVVVSHSQITVQVQPLYFSELKLNSNVSYVPGGRTKEGTLLDFLQIGSNVSENCN